ncbi:MAG: reductive dehalogenase [Candidatus Ranarchaeia archaeon]
MAKKIDELYRILENFQRFDRRYTAFDVARRKQQAKSGGPSTEDKSSASRFEQPPGYSRLDYAFNEAAFTVASATGSGYGNRNSGLYSWNPLGAGQKSMETEAWKGSPQEASNIITKAAKYYGAFHVGFCLLDRRWFYSHDSEGRRIEFEDVDEWYETPDKIVIPEKYRYIIVLTVPMEFKEISYAPAAVNPTSNMGYSRMAALAGTVAEFIRALGWSALPLGNDTALSVPIAIQAGLGHAGRFGRLITWDRGPMVRICKILTDLPVKPCDLAPTGIRRFCETCKKCTEACPAGAITKGQRTVTGPSESNNPGVYKWYVDATACLAYWAKIHTSCAICFRVCPFTRPYTGTQRLIRWFMRNIPLLNRLWVWLDTVTGKGSQADPKAYWM